MYEENTAIVLDNGSALTKAGLAGEEIPLYTFPTLREENSEEPPIKNGIITNWDDMEEIWKVTFSNKLHISPQDHSILLTQPPLSPKKNKERIVEIMFEKFNFPHVFIAIDAVMSHLASGRHAALVVQIGHGITSVVPIEGMYAISDAILKSNTSGGDVTEYLRQTLKDKNINIDLMTAQDIKENLCYIGNKSNPYPMSQEYILPDSTVIKLNEELSSCGEVLFNPLLLDREVPGVHEMIYKSVMKCSIDSRRQFWNNIILSGASANFRGLDERLNKELEAKVSPNTKFNIADNHKDRERHVWIGSSMLASLSTFNKTCVSKMEYEENGLDIVHAKCSSGIP